MTHVSQIGPIPQWIKDLRAPGYKNVFELGIDPHTIYGTEHLFGDWNGELLIFAQDFAPADEVNSLILKGLPFEKVYRHNDGDGRYKTGYRTNTRLLKFLGRDRSSLQGIQAAVSGILYGNACYFLKQGEKSDRLVDFKPGCPAYDGSVKVLNYVVAAMKNLKAIVCLGGAAHNMLLQTNHGKSISLYAVPHPSRGSDVMHNAAWLHIKQDAGLDCLK